MRCVCKSLLRQAAEGIGILLTQQMQNGNLSVAYFSISSIVGEGKWFLNVEHAASLVHVRFNRKCYINKLAACSTFKDHLPSSTVV